MAWRRIEDETVNEVNNNMTSLFLRRKLRVTASVLCLVRVMRVCHFSSFSSTQRNETDDRQHNASWVGKHDPDRALWKLVRRPTDEADPQAYQTPTKSVV